MISTSQVEILLLASAPGVLLVVIGFVPIIRRKAPKAIAATAVAMGLALLLLQLVVAGTLSFGAQSGLAESELVIVGLPLFAFLVTLGVLSRRGRLSIASAAASGIIGVVGLWYLGGAVLMLTACGISPSGGC